MTMPDALVFALPFAFAACAAPPPAKAPDPSDELSLLTVDYRVTSRAPDGALIVGGAMGVSRMRDAVFKQATAHGDVELELEARRLSGDDVVVLVRYKESSSEGGKIVWEPTLVVRKNAETSVVVDSIGGGRALTLALR